MAGQLNVCTVFIRERESERERVTETQVNSAQRFDILDSFRDGILFGRIRQFGDRPAAGNQQSTLAPSRGKKRKMQFMPPALAVGTLRKPQQY